MTKMLSDAETERLIEEIVKAAPDGISEDEVGKACGEFYEMAMLAELVKLWRDGSMRVGWNIDGGEITWAMTERGRQIAETAR